MPMFRVSGRRPWRQVLRLCYLRLAASGCRDDRVYLRNLREENKVTGHRCAATAFTDSGVVFGLSAVC